MDKEEVEKKSTELWGDKLDPFCLSGDEVREGRDLPSEGDVSPAQKTDRTQRTPVRTSSSPHGVLINFNMTDSCPVRVMTECLTGRLQRGKKQSILKTRNVHKC